MSDRQAIRVAQFGLGPIGIECVREIVESCPDLGVKYLTIFAFSTENWKRTQTEVAGLLEELRDLLLAAEVIEWVEEDEAYEPIVGVHDMAEAQAFFNWIGIEEDRSHGVHNPTYIKALLENSIEALMP